MAIAFPIHLSFSIHVLDGDQPGNSQLRLWTDLICRVTPVDDAEVGPLGPTKVDRTPFLTEVNAWATLWAQEVFGGPGTRLLEEIERAKAAKTKRAPSPPIHSFRDPNGALVISFLGPPVESEEMPAPASATALASAPSPQDISQELNHSAMELDRRTPEGNLPAALESPEGEGAAMDALVVDSKLKTAGQTPLDYQLAGDSLALQGAVVRGDDTRKPEATTASASKAHQQPQRDGREVPPKRKAVGADDALDSSAEHSRASKRVRIAGTAGSDGVEDEQEGDGTEDERESNGMGDEQEDDGAATMESSEAEGRVTRSRAGNRESRGKRREGNRRAVEQQRRAQQKRGAG
ncbi:hypothetical protein FS837_012909 [Tulasnella sp. UAMH 9824]|nr:hypothetical protein FS837_012909 [Tulasnella sp. UAMH 9824]